MQKKDLPDHLYPLQNGQWALWREVVLRGAGFPLDMVLPLALPECIPLAEQLLQTTDEMKEARKAVWAFLQRSRQSLDKKQYAALSKLMRTVKDTDIYQTQYSVHSEEFVRLNAVSQRLAELQADFQHVFTAASQRTSHYLQTIARQERFREAVIWQNRQALHGSIASLLQVSPDTLAHMAKQRKQEALVASYLQRYCTKNDTIGFFGPVGWAQIAETAGRVSFLPGSDLLATRKVYFEGWGIDALAKSLASDPALRPWLIPRLLPYIHVLQTTLSLPFSQPIPISELEAAVLQACNGQQTAQDIASTLLRSSRFDLQQAEDVYTILEQFRQTRRIVWTWEISLDEINPEQGLRRLLERITDTALRQACLEKLDLLEQARDAIAHAAGHSEQLDLAFANLETTFTALTSLAPQRADGQMYAARTLVYEDCRRDLQVHFDPQIIHELEQPLQLLLQSARWLTYYIAALYRKAFMQTYTSMVQKTGNKAVPFSEFWLWVNSLLVGKEEQQVVKPLIQAFQRRWTSILRLSSQERCLAYSSAELSASVQSNFPAPQPGWNSAHYHSPDILLAANSVEAIRAGDFQFILGEMHVALNTLQAAVFREQHPQPEMLLQYIKYDLPDPRVLPVPSHDFLPITRTRPSLTLPKDYYLLFAADACAPDKGQALPVSSLFVEQVGNGLLVRAYDQPLAFDIIEVFAEFLSEIASHLFTLAPPDEHTPRVSIDRMVVLRETWTFRPEMLQFAQCSDAQERFLAARRWTKEHHIPRFCFIKTPVEQKPCFVDFDSSVYIDILAKLARRTMEANDPHALLTISEMLPTPEQTWLQDQQGARYTNELRIAALDLSS